MISIGIIGFTLGLVGLSCGFPQPQSGGPVCPQCENPTGCYSGGLKWSDLHGSLGGDFPNEVYGDATNVCGAANGVSLTIEAKSNPWEYCTTWAAEDGKVNHIYWAITNSGKDAADRVVNYDECLAGFNKEIGACEHGSTQITDGYQYWVDPNEGPCP